MKQHRTECIWKRIISQDNTHLTTDESHYHDLSTRENFIFTKPW